MNRSVLILRMVRGGWERAEIGTWLTECFCGWFADTALLAQAGFLAESLPRLVHGTVDSFPTLVARNNAARTFLESGVGTLVMVDHDMLPAPGFFRHALEFLADHSGPALVGSPYRTGPPNRAVEVVYERPFGSGKYERAQADKVAAMEGTRRAAGIGAGLVAINRAAFDAVSQPYFDYEFKDVAREQLAWGEDMYFCRKLTAAGGKVWVAWDHWSQHAKTELVGKPEALPEPALLEMAGTENERG